MPLQIQEFLKTQGFALMIFCFMVTPQFKIDIYTNYNISFVYKCRPSLLKLIRHKLKPSHGTSYLRETRLRPGLATLSTDNTLSQ